MNVEAPADESRRLAVVDEWLERNRAVVVGAAAYVLLRLLLVVTLPVNTEHLDTPSYLESPSFVGGQSRPWVVPLLNWLLPPRGVVVAQAAVSGIAFVLFAAALATTLRQPWVRRATVVVVLLIGVAPRVTQWDTALLSESIGVSTTLLLVAALVRIDRLPRVLTASAFVAWLFTRDGHMYLGILVVTGVVVWGVRHRDVVLPIVFVGALAWAGVAAANNHDVEQYNVTANVSYRIASDRDRESWFVTQGMPDVWALEIPGFNQRLYTLLRDGVFQEWASGEGSATYARFLVSHPGFTLAPLALTFRDGQMDNESLVDDTFHQIMPRTRGPGFAFPREASAYVFTLSLFGLIGLVVLIFRGGAKRATVPMCLLFSTLPHALLVIHASPWEIARHGLVLAVVLVLSSWWLVALAVDESVMPTREPDDPPPVHSRATESMESPSPELLTGSSA